MKADPQHQRLLLDLAAADADLARIAHRRAHLPEQQRVAELEADLIKRTDEAATVSITRDDLDRDIAKLDAEVTSVRKREDRDRELMDGGTLTAKALTEMEHEFQSLKRRQAVLEDDELELMERREAVEADFQQAGAHVDRVRAELDGALAERDRALGDADDDDARTANRRTAIRADVPEELLSLYDRQRTNSGVGAALFRAKRCGACRIELNRAEISHIAGATDDDLLACPECGAYLIRTNESGL